MANNSHQGIDHCYRIWISIISSLRTQVNTSALLNQKPRRLCRYGDPSSSFRHFRTLCKQIIHVVWQGFYLLKLEVGGKIVVIRENLNSRILQNRPFAKIFHHKYFPAYGRFYTPLDCSEMLSIIEQQRGQPSK